MIHRVYSPIRIGELATGVDWTHPSRDSSEITEVLQAIKLEASLFQQSLGLGIVGQFWLDGNDGRLGIFGQLRLV